VDDLKLLAALIKQRSLVDAEITATIGRPAHLGHLGEFIASRVFQISVLPSAAAKGYDGYFTQGPLKGRSVNIRWYARREGLLDLDPSGLADCYLVLAGPRGPAPTGDAPPWLIRSVHLFDASELAARLAARGVTMGIATSVTEAEWDRAEVYPDAVNPLLPLSDDQRRMLALFG
jgi:hypothetical protein